jgi:hypothetical protein
MGSFELFAILLLAVSVVVLASWKLIEKWEEWRSERRCRAREEERHPPGPLLPKE